MYQYQIAPNKELTTTEVAKIIQDFIGRLLPKLKKYNDYYDGKQAILLKKRDTGKPCNKVIVNYCYQIVNNYLGYLTGIPVSYENDGFDEVIDILKYNDYITEDSEMLRQALIHGRSFELNYIDEEGKQRFKILDSKQCIPVYDNTLNANLRYVVRYWRDDLVEDAVESYFVEVYSESDYKKYRSTVGFTSFELIEQYPHYYGQCPITVFSLNKDETSIFDQILTLQDAYNDLLSGEVDDFDAFADAYLVLKGVTADAEDLESMKQNRVLMMDADCSAEYLTKNISDTQIANMLQNINDHIHTVSNSPDFNDKDFMAQSGIALRYKLVGFENSSSAIEANMRKALQRRIELISEIMHLTSDEVWRDVVITFTRNLPTDLSDTVQVVNNLRGLVSDETLLGLLPFITDVREELAKLKKQQEEQQELFQFDYRDINNEELLDE